MQRKKYRDFVVRENMVLQVRYFTYDVTLKCLQATVVVVEKQFVLHNLSACS